jgi:DIS3-like exonuclease 2
MAQIQSPQFPFGKVHGSLGQAGTVEGESRAIAHENKVKDADFTEEVEACVMQSCDIPSREELAATGRRDLRESEFVCTIDPATARDLDDALSIVRTATGYRVGVHIADVSHFVPMGSELDLEAKERATSVYFVERVIPMLPRRLCEDYCSLNAGVDKFAFSGIWEFDNVGNVTSEWFGQSLIRNRCRMAYGDAQLIIEGDKSGDTLVFKNEDEPREVLVKKVVKAVDNLAALATKLRARRFERGALSLNKKKVRFVFEDFNSRLSPQAIALERSGEANWLVEEFMLHANCSVAAKVAQFMPEETLLRKHPAPTKLGPMAAAAKDFGFTITPDTSKRLAASLAAYKDHPDGDTLRFMATLCMQRAQYCHSGEDKANSIAHYALAAPIYTHFTSPIRRYADLVTHRQLLLALEIEQLVLGGAADGSVDPRGLPHGRYYLDIEEVCVVAAQCNEKKQAAQSAGEASTDLFLCLFLQAVSLKSQLDPTLPAVVAIRVVVVRIKDGAFMLFSPELGLSHELTHNNQSQPWIGTNKQEKDHSAFVIDWGPKDGSRAALPPAAGPAAASLAPYLAVNGAWVPNPNVPNAASMPPPPMAPMQPPPQQSGGGGGGGGGLPVHEKVTLFSQFIVTLRTVIRGRMSIDMLMRPPWNRDAGCVTDLQSLVL